MSNNFGIMDNREALCVGCKSLPPVDQLLGHHHRIHDLHGEFEKCACPFCVWLFNLSDKTHLKKLEDLDRQASVELAGFQDGNNSWSMFLIFEANNHQRDMRFDMVARASMYSH